MDVPHSVDRVLQFACRGFRRGRRMRLTAVSEGYTCSGAPMNGLRFVGATALRAIRGAGVLTIGIPDGRELAGIDLGRGSILDLAEDGTALVCEGVGEERRGCLVSASGELLTTLDWTGTYELGQMRIYRDRIVGVRTTRRYGPESIATWDRSGRFRGTLARIESPNSKSEFSIAEDTGVLAWVTGGALSFLRWEDGRVLGSIHPEGGRTFASCCVLTRDGSRCIVGGTGHVTVVDVGRLRILAAYDLPGRSLAVSRDGRSCVSAEYRGPSWAHRVVTWEIATGRVIDAIDVDLYVCELALSDDGARMAWAGRCGPGSGLTYLFVRDLTGTPRELLGPDVREPVLALALSGDEVVAGDTRRLALPTLDERPPRPLARMPIPQLTLEQGTEEIFDGVEVVRRARPEEILALAPESGVGLTSLVSIGDPGSLERERRFSIRRIDLATGSRQELCVLLREPVAASISARGDRAMVQDEGGRVLLFDLPTHTIIADTATTLAQSGRRVTVALAPDGQRWLSASGGRIEVRFAADPEPLELLDLSSAGDEVTSALFLPERGGFLLGTEGGAVLRFELVEAPM